MFHMHKSFGDPSGDPMLSLARQGKLKTGSCMPLPTVNVCHPRFSLLARLSTNLAQHPDHHDCLVMVVVSGRDHGSCQKATMALYFMKLILTALDKIPKK